MKIKNYSAEPLNKLYGWLPKGLQAEEVVFFPDACPGRSPLPTGTVVYTKQADWRKFAISDVGCGMLFAKSNMLFDDFREELWDQVYYDLKANKGKLGDLGSGNHFLDALQCYDDDYIYFLIHTGSRKESGIVDDLIDSPLEFDAKFDEVISWAEENRRAVAQVVEKHFGKLKVIMDKNHNHFEILNDGVIIRKGANRVAPGELVVLPSNLEGDVILARGTDKVGEVFNSLNHGTGRVMSRSDAKTLAANYDYKGLRKRVYIPEMISDAAIKTEAPFCYRNLEDCLALIDELIVIEKRFSPFAYIGQM